MPVGTRRISSKVTGSMMLTFALSEFNTKMGVGVEVGAVLLAEAWGALDEVLGVACVSEAKKNSSKL